MSAATISLREADESRQRDAVPAVSAPSRPARKRGEPQARIDVTKPLECQPAYLRFADVAALLGKSVRTISSWEQRGLLRVMRPAGGTPIVSRVELERLLREGAANGC